MSVANVNPISTRTSPGAATSAGLLLAMFGTPLFLWLFKLDVGDADSLPLYLGREFVVFAMAAALLLIVRKGERLPFSSLGWHTDRLGRSLLWGLLGVVLAALGLAACIVIAQALGWKLGLQEPPKFDPPLWAMTITVLRAGVTEELFYRGYALERLRTLTGSPWIAGALTVVPFALFHYRQGPAGILIAGVAAIILTALYLKRRDLPAVMFTHFTVDFIPNILLPLLGVEP
jgi:membrane protease YdiL (CAAX protease family)